MVPTSTASRSARPDSINPRRWQRVSVCLPADLFSVEAQRTALVINLCSHGAMVELPLPPPPGSEVLLYCGAIAAEGSVVWQGAQHCGIRFHTPIEEAEVDSEARCSKLSLAQLFAR